MRVVLEFLAGVSTNWRLWVVIAIWLAGALAALHGLRGGNRRALTPILWFGVPVVGIISLSFAHPFLVPRYFLPVVPACALLTAMVFDRVGRVGWLGIAAVLVLTWPATEDAVRTRRPDWRTATAVVFDHTEPGDAIVFIGDARHPAEYYWERDGGPNAPTPVFPPYEWGTAIRLYPRVDFTDAMARTHRADRVWVLTRIGSKGVSDSARVAVRHLVESHPLDREWHFGSQITLALYD